MALKDRLNTLRRQAGRQQQSAPAPSSSNLAERIQRHTRVGRPKVGRNSGATPALKETLGAEELAPGLLLIEKQVPLTQRHGTSQLCELQRMTSDLPETRGLEPHGLVFIDTETTGLSGGTGTVAFLVGLARLTADSLTIRQYLLTAFSGERALLSEAGAWLQDAQALVSFNGKSFDLPLLLARCRLANVVDPFSRLAHVDLLYPTRRAYGRQWADCRLITAEQQLLGFRRENDLPGSEAPAAWFSFVQRGDHGRLPGVAQHNQWDLISLAALIPALEAAHAEPGRWQADILSVAKAHIRLEDHQRALHLLRAHASQLDESGALELAGLHRRRREWAEALSIWEGLAARGCVEALERLAKYHEHQRKDYSTALAYAVQLPGLLHEQRRRRLEAKLQGCCLFADSSD